MLANFFPHTLDMCGGKKVHCNQNIHFHLNQFYAPQPFGAIVWIQMVLMLNNSVCVHKECTVYLRHFGKEGCMFPLRDAN